MADTHFTDDDLAQSNRIVASWLNDVNDLRYGASDSSRGAALLQFMAAGAGSIAQTVQARIGELGVSVVSKGADPTGVADCYDAFMAALAVSDVVTVPLGFSFRLKTQVPISGNKTIIGVDGGTKAAQSAIIIVDPSLVGPAFYANTNEYGGICIANLSFAGGNGDYAIENHRPQSLFYRLNIEGTSGAGYNGNGIKLTSTGGGGNFGSWGNIIEQVKWVGPASITSYRAFQVATTGGNCTVINNCLAIRGQIGINVDLCEGLLISNFNANLQVSGLYGTAPATACAAIRLSGVGVKEAIKIMTSWLEQSSYGVYVEKVSSLLFDTCWISGQGNGDGGVFLATNNPNVTENVTVLNSIIRCGKAAPASAMSVDGAVNTIVQNSQIISAGTLSLVNLATTAAGVVTLFNSKFSPAPTNASANFAYVGDSSGGVVSCATGVATTAFTLPGVGGYTVDAFQSGSGAPADYSANAIMIHNGTNAVRRSGTNGANLTITLSGADVQVTQTSGGTISIDFVWSRRRST